MSKAVVHKYKITPGRCEVETHTASKVLYVAAVGDDAYVWIMVDPESPKEKRVFTTVASGEEFDPFRQKFVGTFLIPRSEVFGRMMTLVFHVFVEQ